MPSSWLKKLGLVVVALALSAGGGVAFAWPALAAAACPGCYGFARTGSNLYIERAATPDERGVAQRVIDEARAQTRAFYGELASDPRVIICVTEPCYRRLGGGSRGVALADVVLALSPRGLNRAIASHEMSHIELHKRLGWLRTWRRDIPQWFDEGLAVFVSNDDRYLAPPGAADRCLREPDADMPTTRSAWIERAENDALYAKAACRVSRWIAAQGGSDAALQLIAKVARGEPFEEAFR